MLFKLTKVFAFLSVVILIAACAHQQDSTNKLASQQDELLSLSLKELMSIPVNSELESFKIHQSSRNKVAEDTVQFGLFAPISEFPAYSAEIVIAAEMAVELINNSGGISGKRLVLLRADDKENTSVSAELAKELVDQYQVSAFIGPSTSDSVVDVLKKVAIPSQIPIITQGASSMRITDIAGDHAFWRMTTNNQQQIELMTEFLKVGKSHTKVWLVTGRDLYSEEIAEGIKKNFSDIDNGYVDHLAISDLVFIDVMDLRQEIAAAKSNGVTAIITTLVNQQVKGFIEKIKTNWQQPFPTILIGDTVTPKYLIDANLGEITSCIFSYDGTHGGLTPELTEEIESQIDTTATGIHGAYIFDAVMLQAMAKVLSDEFDLPLKLAMQKITGEGIKIEPGDYAKLMSLYKEHGELSYHGYSGRVHFSEMGDNLSAKQTMYSIGDGKSQEACL